MYYTPTDLINIKILADRAEIDTAIIASLIERDIISPLKQRMTEGVNYYNSRHDILAHKNYYYVDGVKTEDLVKSNNTIPHSFHKILVDQKADYIVGNPIVVSIAEADVQDENKPTTQEQNLIQESEDFQTALLEILGENFDELIGEAVKNASNKSIEWVHFYVDPKGELHFVVCPAEQIIPIYDTQYQDKLIYIIRYYIYDLIDDKGEMHQRHKVEWWTDKGVAYWVETLENLYVHDPDYEYSQAGHFYTFNTSSPSVKEWNSWGQIPFVALWNNPELHTDLRPVKALIDAYDKVKSGWCNDLEDFQELIYILKGYNGLSEASKAGLSELAFFVKNLKTHKAVNVEQGGDVTTLKADIPVEAKIKFLEITRKEIFYFGRGIDVDNENIRSAASGVALKFLYAQLDMKANRTIRKLKKFLKEFMWFIVTYINMRDGKTYDSDQVIFTINKSVIFSEKEKVDELVALKGIISDQTLLENLPMIDDADEEMARIEAERLRADEQSSVDLNKVPDQMYDANGNPITDPNYTGKMFDSMGKEMKQQMVAN